MKLSWLVGEDRNEVQDAGGGRQKSSGRTRTVIGGEELHQSHSQATGAMRLPRVTRPSLHAHLPVGSHSFLRITGYFSASPTRHATRSETKWIVESYHSSLYNWPLGLWKSLSGCFVDSSEGKL